MEIYFRRRRKVVVERFNLKNLLVTLRGFLFKYGGAIGVRTRVHGVADRCMNHSTMAPN